MCLVRNSLVHDSLVRYSLVRDSLAPDSLVRDSIAHDTSFSRRMALLRGLRCLCAALLKGLRCLYARVLHACVRVHAHARTRSIARHANAGNGIARQTRAFPTASTKDENQIKELSGQRESLAAFAKTISGKSVAKQPLDKAKESQSALQSQP